MMAGGALPRSVYYKLDSELRLIHLFNNCNALKMAIKFGYVKELVALTEEDLDRLDALLQTGWRCCHTCYKREEHSARIDNRRRRPGFGKEPRR